MSFETRFWKHVKKTDTCWLWTGFLDSVGRGRLRPGRADQGTGITSARASWIVHFGSIPDGKFVLHHCDNPTCVRPDHLYLGTQQDNMRDRKVRKRHHILGHGELVSGELNPHARLTWKDVLEIRSKHLNGTTVSLLAKYYKVTVQNIHSICKNKTWIKPPTP